MHMAELEHKPTRQEDEYFAREDVEALRRLAHKQKADTEAKAQDALRALHHMKCPKCGFDLHPVRQSGLELDTCFHCQGVFLDHGELGQLLEHQREGKHE